MARPCRGCGRALIFWPPFTETERVQSEVEVIGEDAPEHDDDNCIARQAAAAAAYAARPKCMVDGCRLPSEVRIVDRDDVGLRGMLTGRARLLCERHADRNHDLDETTDGKLYDRRPPR